MLHLSGTMLLCLQDDILKFDCRFDRAWKRPCFSVHHLRRRSDAAGQLSGACDCGMVSGQALSTC